jgi:C4-dicarboxylate transporter DctM subunit
VVCNVALILIGLLLGLLALNVPVATAFGLAAATFLALRTDIPLTLIPQQMYGGTDSTVLQAVPFFLLAGALMDKGGISRRLVSFAQYPGRLDHHTGFGGIAEPDDGNYSRT